MLITKYLKAGNVEEVNAAAQFIKVINCESELRIRATNGADIIVDTVARAGFEMQTAQVFTLIEITAEQPQKVEMWISKHKLSYDALTKGSNSNQSSLIEHFGGSQKVLPFESNRKAITLFSDSEPFWYGGEGVTVENGIPVGVGTARYIEGAGELHIAIDKTADKKINGFNRFVVGTKEGGLYGAQFFDKKEKSGDAVYFIEPYAGLFRLSGGVVSDFSRSGAAVIDVFCSDYENDEVYVLRSDGRVEVYKHGVFVSLITAFESVSNVNWKYVGADSVGVVVTAFDQNNAGKMTFYRLQGGAAVAVSFTELSVKRFFYDSIASVLYLALHDKIVIYKDASGDYSGYETAFEGAGFAYMGLCSFSFDDYAVTFNNSYGSLIHGKDSGVNVVGSGYDFLIAMGGGVFVIDSGRQFVGGLDGVLTDIAAFSDLGSVEGGFFGDEFFALSSLRRAEHDEYSLISVFNVEKVRDSAKAKIRMLKEVV